MAPMKRPLTGMSSTCLNRQGDFLLPTTGHHGADIASQRIDELDRTALRYALEARTDSNPIIAVDLGAGLGAQTARFAALGLSVLSIDLLARPDFISKLQSLFGEACVSHYEGDVRTMPDESLPSRINILYSQRMIHYLRYHEAITVLSRFAARMTPDAKAFISCACIASELSEGYAMTHAPIAERFGHLSPLMSAKHNVLQPLCLYSCDEFENLAQASGFSPIEITQSQFGTLKGIFKPRAGT